MSFNTVISIQILATSVFYALPLALFTAMFFSQGDGEFRIQLEAHFDKMFNSYHFWKWPLRYAALTAATCLFNEQGFDLARIVSTYLESACYTPVYYALFTFYCLTTGIACFVGVFYIAFTVVFAFEDFTNIAVIREPWKLRFAK